MAGVETLVATIHHLPCQLAKFVLTFILFVIRESDSSGDLRLEDRVKAHLLVVNARCKAFTETETGVDNLNNQSCIPT
jgi:hypothetical protein